MAYTTPPALLRHTRTLPSRLAIATLLAALAGELQAFEVGDPFATGALTPPPPALIIDGAALPCQPLAADVPYGVLEVVDLALCRNPTTREVVVCGAAAGGPGRSGASRFPAGPRRPRRRQPGEGRFAERQPAQCSLTLSWLLFDFGARSANLEVARS
jgi:outer membrane protein